MRKGNCEKKKIPSKICVRNSLFRYAQMCRGEFPPLSTAERSMPLFFFMILSTIRYRLIITFELANLQHFLD